jgi:hypothetical protein
VLADLQLETVVTDLIAAARKAAAALEKAEDWKAYWAVNYDLVKALQGLGVFGMQEKPIDPSLMRDQQQQEIDAMVQLELKRRARQDEMLQAHHPGG